MTETADIAIHHQDVLGTTMAYRELGAAGAPVALFLHGNPASSYIWRNIMPHVAPVAHGIAPDLIGFGQSGKPDIAYRFFDQARYLDAFIDSLCVNLGVRLAYLGAQDWGAALAYHLAARRPDSCAGLPSWSSFAPLGGFPPESCRARNLSQVQDAGRGRGDEPASQRVHRADPAQPSLDGSPASRPRQRASRGTRPDRKCQSQCRSPGRTISPVSTGELSALYRAAPLGDKPPADLRLVFQQPVLRLRSMPAGLSAPAAPWPTAATAPVSAISPCCRAVRVRVSARKSSQRSRMTTAMALVENRISARRNGYLKRT
jgi:pimeloyl-ACP methyl ester carboxylesterase